MNNGDITDYNESTFFFINYSTPEITSGRKVITHKEGINYG